MRKDSDKPRGSDGDVNSTSIKVFGARYIINSSEDPAYTRKVADYVDRKMRELAKESRVFDHAKLAILAAMEVADELLMTRRKRYAMIGRTGSATERLARTVAREANRDRRISAPAEEGK